MDDGDWVRNGSPVCTLDVNGVSLPVAADHDGFLTVIARDLVAGGELQPGSVIGYVTRPSESVPSTPDAPESIQLPKRAGVDTIAVELRREWEPPTKKRAASPRARQAARDAGVPLRAIRGTGYRGRVTQRDVHAAAPAIAATGGAVVPAWHAAQHQVSKLSPKKYQLLCHQQATELLKRITADDLSQCDFWDASAFELTLSRLENGLTTYHRIESDGSRGKQVADDELETNMVPLFRSDSGESHLLIPPLPPGGLFSLGFSAVVASPVIVKGKLTAGHVLTCVVAFDSQRLAPDTVERWLADS